MSQDTRKDANDELEGEVIGIKMPGRLKHINPFSVILFLILLGIGGGGTMAQHNAWIGVGFFIVALIVAFMVKIAKQWERAVVLRLGKYKGVKGPGIFAIVPVFESIAYWIDLRVITTIFKAESTLTRDNVPVDVDAVLFWHVVNPMKAALEVESYRMAVSWAAQTALRDIIGRADLSDMLAGRLKLDKDLGDLIDERVSPWGVRVVSVELRDVTIPPSLEDAMSMQAQAERERQARVILGDSELIIAEKFEEASRRYIDNPTALHLRAMNMLYEGLKGQSTIMVVPSTALDSMNLGTMAGLAAMAKEYSHLPKSDGEGTPTE